MLNRSINILVPLLFLLSILLSCKEELVVEQKKENNTTAQSALAKTNGQLSSQQDSISQKEKKEKVKRLKKEHEKPYVVIEKPEKLLLEKLKSRLLDNPSSKTLNKSGSFSIQSLQSCYVMEVDVWVFVKYHPISGLTVGISPKGSYHYPDNKFWQYDRNILTTLKYTYGFSKINMGPMAIIENNNVVYTASEILAGISLDYNAVVNQFSSYNLGTLWGSYIDEPMHNAADASDCRQKLSSIKTWWKNNIGSSS